MSLVKISNLRMHARRIERRTFQHVEIRNQAARRGMTFEREPFELRGFFVRERANSLATERTDEPRDFLRADGAARKSKSAHR